MLIQALAEYADRYLAAQTNNVAFEDKSVPWSLDISPQGSFLSAIPRMTTVTRGKKSIQMPLPMCVPRSPVNRNSGEHPLLGADDIAYVLGPGAWTSDKPADQERARKHHEAFVAFLRDAARQTNDEALLACACFYERAGEVEKARAALSGAKSGTLVALFCGGPVLERPPVQAFWRRHYEAAFSERMGEQTGECLISGRHGAIAPTHEKIKGVASLGGQASGVALMSFDKEAFRSYGWERNQNSPVSPNRAMAYVLALNDLLRDAGRTGPGRRTNVAGIGFLTWLSAPDSFDAWNVLERPDPKEVEALLKFDPNVDPDPKRFYLAGVSGNGARLRVRYWVSGTLTEIKQNLKSWHEQLRVDYPWDARPVELWQVLYAIHPDGKPPGRDVVALIRRGLEGPAQPLDYSILAAALGRLRHPGAIGSEGMPQQGDRLSPARLRVPMGLIRMCLNDIARLKGGKEMGEGLDQNCVLPAYVCGRLMAEFENLQRVSSEGEVNSSVLDRYFTLASTYPAIAFPKVADLAMKHLRKLRRDKPGAARAIDRRFQELHGLIQPGEGGAYPARLSLAEQGLFALGYYHQKAWSIEQAMNRKESSSTEDSSEQENRQ